MVLQKATFSRTQVLVLTKCPDMLELKDNSAAGLKFLSLLKLRITQLEFVWIFEKNVQFSPGERFSSFSTAILELRGRIKHKPRQMKF